MDGGVSILNVGAGDTKLSFDSKNPAERIRAARIVRDMLRRGYALLVEVEQPDGTKAFQRALDFDENAAEYIIADYDPSYAVETARPAPREYVSPPRYGAADHQGETTTHEEASEAQAAGAETSAAEPAAPAAPRRRGRPTRRLPAASTRAVAVARSAGG